MASPRHFGKGPLISTGVQNGWLPKIGCLRVLSDIILVYFKKTYNKRSNPNLRNFSLAADGRAKKSKLLFYYDVGPLQKKSKK